MKYYGGDRMDRVKISAYEYACLVSANERLEMLRSVIETETDEYGSYAVLRLILNSGKHEEEGK